MEGLIYHEQQTGRLCGVHVINCLLQGEFFTEIELGNLAQALDSEERALISNVDGAQATPTESANVSTDGNFSIQVLSRALSKWSLDLEPVAKASLGDGSLVAEAYLCHRQDHWFAIRMINSKWFDLNSSSEAPQLISEFYLSAYLASLIDEGCIMFSVSGTFPSNDPLRGSATSYGKWWTLEAIEDVKKKEGQIRSKDSKRDEDEQIREAILRSMNDGNGTNLMCSEEDPELAAAISESLKEPRG
ncbi:hypothetical protein NDN08_006606 [Rhodosorus marinus]|uniref:ubiquitinyl hydrolase 1 n=1 Tax=Rhodosorus marinus TaxID=101924 RepID=A0AAV8UM70_9RHOD|nr:hypothetical protein NDN08_006606 [Rhodosorus marinus]